MKTTLAFALFMTAICYETSGQTIVSGGIYSNTTWTKANSPYISNSVVVFPNVLLTIEPGVTVRVNGVLEIRESQLIAIGNSMDSITFIPDTNPGNFLVTLSNAHSCKFSYCNFRNNHSNLGVGLDVRLFSNADTLLISNSKFSNNKWGMNASATPKSFLDSCIFENDSIAMFPTIGTISNSIIKNNKFGLASASGAIITNCLFDSNLNFGIESNQLNTIMNCQILNNGIGISFNYNSNGFGSQIHHNIIESNNLGIQLHDFGTNDSIYCNKICNNVSYNLYISTPSNRHVKNNYWCSTDSLMIANSIYDGYDNATVGLVDFMPVDSNQCYLTTGILSPELRTLALNIYPNPATNYLQVEVPMTISNGKIGIYNILGELLFSSVLTKLNGTIDISTLKNGAYFVKLSSGELIGRQTFLKISSD